MNKEELLFEELYEKTKDCGRVQFVKLLMTKERENNQLKKINDRLYNENCKLREKHYITDIRLLDENYELRQQYVNAVADYETVMTEKKQLQDKWDKLKEYFNERIEVCDNRLSSPFCNVEKATKERLIFSQCLEKLEELEQGSDSNDSNR